MIFLGGAFCEGGSTVADKKTGVGGATRAIQVICGRARSLSVGAQFNFQGDEENQINKFTKTGGKKGERVGATLLQR